MAEHVWPARSALRTSLASAPARPTTDDRASRPARACGTSARLAAPQSCVPERFGRAGLGRRAWRRARQADDGRARRRVPSAQGPRGAETGTRSWWRADELTARTPARSPIVLSRHPNRRSTTRCRRRRNHRASATRLGRSGARRPPTYPWWMSRHRGPRRPMDTGGCPIPGRRHARTSEISAASMPGRRRYCGGSGSRRVAGSVRTMKRRPARAAAVIWSGAVPSDRLEWM